MAWHKILRALQRTHTKGTFFSIGLHVGAYAKRETGLTVRDHMAIGSHTWRPRISSLSAMPRW